MTKPDTLVIGAGHNGLVTAAYLAKAGRKVLVLERRGTTGGQLSAGDGLPPYVTEPLHAGGQLRPDIVRDLDLARHGLPAADAPDAAYVSLLPDGGQLRLSAGSDDAETLASIRRHSARDAARWPEFVAWMNKAAGFLDSVLATPMPRLADDEILREARPLASLAWRLRRLGRRDMFLVIRALPMSAQELAEEWFESEPLKASIAALAMHGATMGSMSAGGGYTLLANWLNRGGPAHRPVPGGTGRVAAALAAAVKAHGGDVRTGATVTQVLVDRQRVRGLRLADGTEILADTIVSAADPRHTLLGLVGAPELPPEFAWAVQSIKMRGSVAKVHALTSPGHGVPAGTIVVAPTIRYLERAYDAAKYGEIAEQPFLEITTSGDVVSIHFQSAPYGLRQGDWNSGRAAVERIAIDTVAAHFPGFREHVREVHTITPPDLERDFGLTEGDMNHGQPLLDQLLFMRPIPGWSDHRTPVDGLYLCGGGAHGGGGVSGAAGRNAARRMLRDLS
jgi:phytoene dehydrogenase-like protein